MPVIDDFNDGIDSGTWSEIGDWTTTNTAYEGAQAARLPQNSVSTDLVTSCPVAEPSSVSVWGRVGVELLDFSWQLDVADQNSKTIAYLTVMSGGEIRHPDGGDSIYTGDTISLDTWYRFRVYNIDYTNETYDYDVVSASGNVVSSKSGITWDGFQGDVANEVRIGGNYENTPVPYADKVGYNDANTIFFDINYTVEDLQGNAIENADVELRGPNDSTATLTEN